MRHKQTHIPFVLPKTHSLTKKCTSLSYIVMLFMLGSNRPQRGLTGTSYEQIVTKLQVLSTPITDTEQRKIHCI